MHFANVLFKLFNIGKGKALFENWALRELNISIERMCILSVFHSKSLFDENTPRRYGVKIYENTRNYSQLEFDNSACVCAILLHVHFFTVYGELVKTISLDNAFYSLGKIYVWRIYINSGIGIIFRGRVLPLYDWTNIRVHIMKYFMKRNIFHPI